ncbi:MAG TPA: hypothetical protein VMS99_04600 [Acidimicrobiia bacterium]|nr:hypothetical protein [Acidimicrobiia bacterium]
MSWWRRIWNWLGDYQTVVFVWSFIGSGVTVLVISILTALEPWQIVLLGAVVFALVLAVVATWFKPDITATPTEPSEFSAPPSALSVLPRATPEEMAQRVIEGRRVRLTDLVDEEGVPFISNREFRECLLEGPAILSPVAPPGPHLRGQQRTATTLDSLVSVVAEKPISGVIGILNLTFRQCYFYRVGFVVPEQALDHWRRTWATALGVVLSADPTQQSTPDIQEPPTRTDE